MKTEEQTAEVIFNKYSWHAFGAISPSKDFCLKAMKEYAAQERNKAIDEALQVCEKMYYEARYSTNITLSQVDAVLLWIRLTKEELEKLKV